MKIKMLAAIAVFSSALLWSGCARNKSWVMEKAPDAAKQNGFEIIGYQGYTWNALHGGFFWYTLRHPSGITYEAAFAKWGDEVHIYNLKALDAIKP